MEIDPNSPLPYWGLGKSLTQLGRYQQAIEVFDSFAKRNGVEPPILTAESGYSLAKWAKKKEARERIEQLVAGRTPALWIPILLHFSNLDFDRSEVGGITHGPEIWRNGCPNDRQTTCLVGMVPD
jgi:tetratricopeptide (TPR) repeat protein